MFNVFEWIFCNRFNVGWVAGTFAFGLLCALDSWWVMDTRNEE